MATKSSTPAQKAKRERSYSKSQERKAERILENEEKQKANDAYRKRGERTPYQTRKTESFLARVAKKHGQSDIDSVE